MKLVSMISGDRRRAGIVLGDEVLDATDFAEILEARGEWIETGVLPEYHHIEGAFQDAVDLFHCGSQCRLSIRSRLAAEPTLKDETRKRGALVPLNTVKLGAPVANPSKILAVGLNYREHAKETGSELPDRPLIFSKCTSSLTGPDAPIRIPRISDQIDYEAELAVVIGAETRSVKAADALNYIAGYTIMNDVTARDLQKQERQWVRAKGLDTFAPCGPWLVTFDEIADSAALDIELRLNGEIRQKSNTSDLIFKIPELIEFISQDLTLKPGDIITTGTPPGVGFARKPPSFLKAGDKIDITIAGIGTLSNTVVGPDGD
jgi:2-keto-4-pentenoate hydratase/2-oxohepta-3-ene-1,7-dioic acid hydratase in catechol pathway